MRIARLRRPATLGAVRMPRVLAQFCLLATLAVLVASQTCQMGGAVDCPLLDPVIQNNTFCAHDPNYPWCSPPLGPGGRSRCVALPAGQVATIRPGCNKCGVNYMSNPTGALVDWCLDATDGCIYPHLEHHGYTRYVCRGVPAPTPVAPVPVQAPVPIAPVPVPVQAPVPVAPTPTKGKKPRHD